MSAADADLIVLVQDATENGTMFPPAYTSIFAKPAIGVVTKSDLASPDPVSYTHLEFFAGHPQQGQNILTGCAVQILSLIHI